MSSYADAYRLAAIVATSDDAIISKDLNGVVQSWNAAAERMFSYTAGEVVGRSITLIIPPERLSEEQEVLSRIRSGHSVEHYETWRRRKDGALVPISLTVSPIRDDLGRVIGASKIARDISDRLRAQEALAEAQRRQRDLQNRLVSLVAASSTLFESPKVEDVMPAIIVLARTMIVADGYAIWRLDSRTRPDGSFPSSASTDSGSTRAPLTRTAQWRCGPVTRPVAPTRPIAASASTRSPSRTSIADRCASMEKMPRP